MFPCACCKLNPTADIFKPNLRFFCPRRISFSHIAYNLNFMQKSKSPTFKNQSRTKNYSRWKNSHKLQKPSIMSTELSAQTKHQSASLAQANEQISFSDHADATFALRLTFRLDYSQTFTPTCPAHNIYICSVQPTTFGALTFWSFRFDVAPDGTGRWTQVGQMVQGAAVAGAEHARRILLQVGGGGQFAGQRLHLQALELIPDFALTRRGGERLGGFRRNVFLAQRVVALWKDFVA